MSDRELIESRAVQWILREEDTNWTAADQAQLGRWLDESDAHMAAYWRLSHGWGLADSSADVSPKPLFGWRMPRHRAIWLMAIAASLLLAMLAGAWRASDWREPAPSILYTTRQGQRGDLQLADGTKIQLNTNTSVRVMQSDANRVVWIEKGEAYFEVAHDPRHPFVVHAGTRDVAVLGTKFNVYRDKAGLVVSVVEGRVHLAAANQTDDAVGVVLVRGDIASVNGASTLIASNSLDRIVRQLQWRKGLLSFDKTMLSSAAEQFNRFNRQQIVITDSALASMRIGGSFRAGDAEGFAKLLQQAFDIHAEFRDDKIMLSKN